MDEQNLPNFIIGGAQKSGTTSLHSALNMHPNIFFPERPQELHFFDLDENFRKGVSWYKNHFTRARPDQIKAQTSPLYLYDSRSAHRIADLIPNVKLVFILRNPVDRAYSHYWHAVRMGQETLPFEEALAQEKDRLETSYESWRNHSYIDRGFYYAQLQRFRKYFDKSQIHVITTEQLKADYANALSKCLQFVGAGGNSSVIGQVPRRNANVYRVPRVQKIQTLTSGWRKNWPRIVRAVDRLNLKQGRYPELSLQSKQALWELFRADAENLRDEYGIELGPWKRSLGLSENE